ncbi:hypothetical protein [Desulfurispira natronophila]|uniref:Outer membrane protein beta-barrel domain-containing protein n=1 Tax=Desulfurispira natronophila TaxID=682562 RepID=A0A7W8DHH8_9BACT|nr:hypothetical protein [Desulfurispira natronophila]MBB5022397.1 hypothetical protein [Desulfurispira natronophila]
MAIPQRFTLTALALCLIITFSLPTSAQAGRLAAGIVAGDITGLNLKYWQSNHRAFDLAAGWSDDEANVKLDYLYHEHHMLNVQQGRFIVYYGMGLYATSHRGSTTATNETVPVNDDAENNGIINENDNNGDDNNENNVAAANTQDGTASNNSEDDIFGVRIPFGVEYFLPGMPLSIFGDVAPAMDIYPETDFSGQVMVGARFIF